MTVFGKPADREDGRLAPQNNHLLGVWMQVLLYIREKETRRTKVKRQNGDGGAVGK